MLRYITISALALVLIPLTVSANTVLRSGESVSIGQNQAVDGDLYAVGGTVTISGSTNGDIYASGGTVTINAPVMADVASLSGTTQIHAPVADDVRVIGGEVTIGDTVKGDILMIGGVLRILSTGSIEGDILFFGGELVVEGPVEGTIFGYAGDVRIDAFVGGDIDVETESALTLGEQAEVLGNITYASRSELVRAQNAVVVGNIQHEKKSAGESFSIESLLIPFFMLAFAALTLFLIFRRHVTQFIPTITEQYGVHGLIGLAAFAGLPFTALILSISVLGIFVGLLIFAIYAVLALTAWILAGVVLGTLIIRTVTKKEQTTVISVVVGTIALQTALFVPFIGPLLTFALFLIVFGALVRSLYRSVIT